MNTAEENWDVLNIIFRKGLDEILKLAELRKKVPQTIIFDPFCYILKGFLAKADWSRNEKR